MSFTWVQTQFLLQVNVSLNSPSLCVSRSLALSSGWVWHVFTGRPFYCGIVEWNALVSWGCSGPHEGGPAVLPVALVRAALTPPPGPCLRPHMEA